MIIRVRKMSNIKAFLKHLKEKWLIYFIVIIIFSLAWYLYWGKLTNPTDDEILFVWVTKAEDSETIEESGVQLDRIMEALEDEKKSLGFKAFDSSMQNVGTTEEIRTFKLTAEFETDIFFLPYDMFEVDTFFYNFKDVVELGLTHPLGEEGIVSHTTEDGEFKNVGMKVNNDYVFAVSMDQTTPSGAIQKIFNFIMEIAYPNT